MRTTIFPASFDQLNAIREFAGQAARDVGMDDSEVYAVEMAVDEACTNVIEHAYRGINDGDIECTCDTGEETLTVIIRDHGRPFDQSTLQPPDILATLKHRRVGGLGV
jgi:serine/threonine-protein kinase RsbW